MNWKIRNELTTRNLTQGDANGKPKYPGAHMLRWAQNEPGESYRLVARRIPTEVQGTAPIAVRIVKFADLPDSDEIE